MTGIVQQLETLVSSAKRKAPDARFVGLHSQSNEALPEAVLVGDERWTVHRVQSSLQARKVLVEAGDDGRAVFVTPLRELEVGSEVVARLAMRRLQEFHPWQLVRDQFGARRLDPRVVKEGPWMARELQAGVPAGGYAPVPSGLLDLDTAWSVLYPRLGLSGSRPGVGEYLAASAEGQLAMRWANASEELRKAACERLKEQARSVGAQLGEVLERKYGDLLVPLGLVLAMLGDERLRGGAKALAARTRLELYGVHAEEPELLRPWADAATRWVSEAFEAGGSRAEASRRILGRAEQLLKDVRAEDLAFASDVLPTGFAARAERLAEALVAASTGNGFDLPAAETEFEGLEQHALAQLDPSLKLRLERARHALRLARWLSSSPRHFDSLAARAENYRSEGAFVDRTRLSIGRGEPDGVLKAVYGELLEAAGRRRELENRAFGERLAKVVAGSEGAGDLLPIEEALERVVAPLAEQEQVLLVVMDGMSESVCEELVADVLRHSRYQRMSPVDEDRLPAMVGLLPSVTEVCRTSLLCGTRRSGGQAEEREGFEQLVQRFGWRGRIKKPLLFHKDTLSGPNGALSAEVHDVIDSTARVVAVVVNAVDDQLDGGDQIELEWNLKAVPLLRELVQTAELAGRALVLTSDHGHVVDSRRTTKADSAGSTARWRPAGSALVEGELEVRGPRVLLPTAGGPCVLPWSERLRYSLPHAGYHGGASPQEVVTPLVVLVPEARLDGLVGWSAEVDARPWWWDGGAERTDAPKPEPVPTAPTPKRVKQPSPMPLFPDPVAQAPVEFAAEATAGSVSWTGLLFSAPLWAEQKKLAGRKPPSEGEIEKVLVALVLAGGKLSLEALRNRTRLPVPRLRGLLTAMSRILNVDGYGVLELDFGDEEVELAQDLLFTQFGIQPKGQA